MYRSEKGVKVFISTFFQQTLGVDLVLVYCWASIADGLPTLNQHRGYMLCLLGPFIFCWDVTPLVVT